MNIDFLVNKIEFFDELTAIIFNEWGRLIPGNKIENTKKKLKSLLNKDKIPLSVVCSDRGILIGAYNLTLSDPANIRKLSPWLGGVYVNPEYRGKGIGTKLVEHSLSISKKAGSSVLFLHTKDKQKMYSRIGFRPIYEVEINGKMVTVMSKFT